MRSASKKGRRGGRRKASSGRRGPCGCPPGSVKHSTRGHGKTKAGKAKKPRGAGFVCVARGPSPFGGKRVTRFVKPKRSC